MIARLRTSKAAKDRLETLNRALHFSSNAVLLRFAMSKSIVCEKPIDADPDGKAVDNGGFEITRSTLFGEYEVIYKYCMGIKSTDSDEKFFPKLASMHIERGLKILEREYKFAGNKEKFLKNIISKIDFCEEPSGRG